MIVPAPDRVSGGAGLGPAFAAARARLGLVALLFALAGIGWWWTAEQMRGMDNGPWTGLGTLGWFLAVWVVMMAAMMFPSVAPTVALYSRMTGRRSLVTPIVFASGYLMTWAGAGALAFALAAAGGAVTGDVLSWDRAGRWVAGATLIVGRSFIDEYAEPPVPFGHDLRRVCDGSDLQPADVGALDLSLADVEDQGHATEVVGGAMVE